MNVTADSEPYLKWNHFTAARLKPYMTVNLLTFSRIEQFRLNSQRIDNLEFPSYINNIT